MRRAFWSVFFAAASVLSGTACSTSASGTISLITGEETDTFSEAPAPTSLVIDSIDQDGGITTLVQSPLPVTGDITLPGQGSGTIAILRATGLDDAGAAVVWGQSLPLQFGALAGLTLPLFVQRTGEFARMPTPLPTPPASPLLAILAGQYVLVTGGSDAAQAASTELYDLGEWDLLDSPPTLPVVPQSMLTIGTQALLINGSTATWFDFSDSSTSPGTLDGGATFTDVAGGVSVTSPAGYAYVVGATRTSAPSTTVLVSDASGDLSLATTTSRKGAAAVWLAGPGPGLPGLVVLGGSTTDAGAGAEILAGTSSSSPLDQFPVDLSTGGGATALDGSHVLLAGGLLPSGADPGARVLDFTCTASSCPPTRWTAPIPPLVSAQAFTLDSKTALVVGNDTKGATHAFRMTSTAATEIAFKVPRKGANALLLPTGAVAVVGGDYTLESFAWPPAQP